MRHTRCKRLLPSFKAKWNYYCRDSNLNDAQVQSILDASTALNRLSKLNQSLLLLAKIENNQYETNEEISLTDITQKYLKLFDELIKDKQLVTEKYFDNDFVLKIHPLLADFIS